MVRKARHKKTGVIFDAWQNDTGELIHTVNGCSGPYFIPKDGWEISYCAPPSPGGGQWNESHGMEAGKFAEEFELLEENEVEANRG